MTSPDIGGAYRRWAALEAHGTSPLYEEWALGVASDEEVAGLRPVALAGGHGQSYETIGGMSLAGRGT